jgi:hypothetical protein
MAYPTLRPSARNYVPGDWATKQFNAVSGSEVRIRYGDKRHNAVLSLEYQNIGDSLAKQFLDHYDSTYGTYKTFALPAEALTGWNAASYIPAATQMQFRYEGPPEVKSIRPGVSTVAVTLIGVV